MIGLESTWQAKYYLRNDRYKFILARQPDLLGNPDRELYDLQADPGEDSQHRCRRAQAGGRDGDGTGSLAGGKNGSRRPNRRSGEERRRGGRGIWEQHRG